MATYTDLFGLYSNTDLRNKVAVAVVVKAQALLDGATPTANEVAWASDAIQSPISKAESLLLYLIAKNKDQTVAAIEGATDTAIQTAVDAAVDAIIAGQV